MAGRLVLTLAFIVIILGMGSAGRAELSSLSEDVRERGKAVYQERCVVCHGSRGRGDGPEAPFLSPPPGNLISASTSAKTDEELLAVIANGKPNTAMPAWKDRLSVEEQRAVLAYIRSLIRFQPPPLTPPPPETAGHR